MTAAKSDRLLRARLASAAGHDEAFDDQDVRDRLEHAIDIPDFVEHAGAYGYFVHVGEALDEVEQLVHIGYPDAAITLAEHALELLESSSERVDDSDGGLAERLVTRAVGSEYEVFVDVLPEYEDVLGSAGLARYRELVEEAWRKLPPKNPNDCSARRSSSPTSWRTWRSRREGQTG